jgi:hypothetical protein
VLYRLTCTPTDLLFMSLWRGKIRLHRYAPLCPGRRWKMFSHIASEHNRSSSLLERNKAPNERSNLLHLSSNDALVCMPGPMPAPDPSPLWTELPSDDGRPTASKHVESEALPLSAMAIADLKQCLFGVGIRRPRSNSSLGTTCRLTIHFVSIAGIPRRARFGDER